MSRPKLFVGNWKMNMLAADVVPFASAFRSRWKPLEIADTAIAAPFTSLWALRTAFPKDIGVLCGAQNVHWLASGPHTGEISLGMLQEIGLDFALVGHSERRAHYGELNAKVKQRAEATAGAGLAAVVCIGESLEEYEQARTKEALTVKLYESLPELSDENIDRIVLAYEPDWAIGTGHAATPDIVAGVHYLLRGLVAARFGEMPASKLKILYGGSVTADNVSGFLEIPDVDGVLVGGASLKPDVFADLITAGRRYSTP